MEILTSRTAALVSRNPGTKRRSIRMALKASVSLSGKDRAKCSFTMLAGATDLNRHGGAIQLKRELLVGSTVGVRNNVALKFPLASKEVNTLDGLRTYGIEFLENDDRAKTTSPSDCCGRGPVNVKSSAGNVYGVFYFTGRSRSQVAYGVERIAGVACNPDFLHSKQSRVCMRSNLDAAAGSFFFWGITFPPRD